MQNAWREVEEALQRLEQEVVDRKNHDGLRRAGLTDVQLALKLRGFNAATVNLDLTQARRARDGWLIRRVKKALRWANVILGSLASVLPGADLVKEYKEAGEIGLDEAIEQENEPRPYLP